jgi:hypothetical protein
VTASDEEVQVKHEGDDRCKNLALRKPRNGERRSNPMKTVYENVSEWSERIAGLLAELQEHSAIHRWNDNTGGVIWLGSDYSWTKLGDEARPIQSRVLEEYRRFSALINVLFKGQPKDTLASLKESDAKVLEVIQQDGITWSQRADTAFAAATEALGATVVLLKRLYDGAEGRVCVVPDTNALLHNPSLETWRFDDVPTFTILLLPTVLAELDALKMNHRVEEVRKKSERIIRQVKEYRRRGRLSEGVTIVRDVSELVAIATEPNVSDSLPWLDSSNNDDRLLASVIEVMRQRPHSPVILVTRDLNLQNKAEFACVPFCEPPDPVPVPEV